MGKRQAKKTAGWSRLWLGTAVSLGMYLLGISVIALLMVKGLWANENAGFILGAWVMLSAACGSAVALRMKYATPFMRCLLQGCVFLLVMFVVGYLCWEGMVWSRTNISLALSTLLGGMLPGLFAGKKKRKRAW